MKPTLLLPFLLAVAPLHAGEPDPVTARYEQLLLRTPEPGPAFDKLYDTYARGEGLEALEKRWQAGAEKGGAPYWLLLGHLAERRGQAAGARAAFRKASELALADYRAWAALGKLEAGQGRQTEAIEAFEKALRTELPEERRIELYRSLALSQQRRLDPEAALKTYERALKDFPTDPYLLDEIAEAQTEAGKFDAARASYEKLRSLAGSDPFRKVSVTVKLAQLEERQGKMKEALAIYESALAMTSDTSWIHREVRNRIEMVYRRQDDLPGLISYYTAWLEKKPKDVEVALRLSKAAGELNQKVEAVRWLSLAAEWAPDRRDLQMELARALRANAQTDEALKLAIRLTERFPDELSYHELRGEVEWDRYGASKDPQHRAEALGSWEHLAPEGTKDAARITALADLLRRHDCVEEALAAYQRALAVSPESMDLRERLAAYFFELKREEDGWKLLQSFVEGERATAENYRRLALLQARYGKPEEALSSIDAGLKLAAEDFALLSLKWRLLVEAKRNAEAIALYEPLLKASPAMADQIDAQQVRLLSRLEAEALKAEIDKLKAAAADAPEHQLRLLVRLLLGQRDLESARKALATARERFPASAALVRAEVELCRAENQTDETVAALRRLIELEPKQITAYQQEIARVYLQASQADKAIEAAQSAIRFSPANAAAHQFLATTCQSLGRIDEARAAYQEAIRLSEQPNPIRSLLASLEMSQGKMEAAQALYEEIFEAETTPDAKRRALQQVAMIYIQSGQIDTLIARFRDRQKAEEGGWRYASYLATIYQQLGDAAQARQELNKVLASRPNDTTLLRELIQLAEREGNREEMVRFASQLLEVEPSAKNASELAMMMVPGDPDGAMELLLSQSAAIEADPEPWMPIFAALVGQARFDDASAIMQRALLRKQEDATAQLRLAEFYLVTRQDEKVADLLWRIYDTESEAADLTQKSAPPVALPPGMQAYTTSAMTRLYSAPGYFQEYQRLRLRNPSMNHYGRTRGVVYGFGVPAAPGGNARTNADRALVYLAALAVDQHEEDAFKQTLKQRVAPLPIIERIGTYQLAGAEDLVQAELATVLQQPKMSRGEQFMLLAFLQNRSNRQAELQQQLIDGILNSDEPMSGSLVAMLRHLAPREKLDPIVKAWLQTKEAAEPHFIGFALQEAAGFGDIRLVEQLCAKGSGGPNQSVYHTALVTAYAKAGEKARLRELLVKGYEEVILSGTGPGRTSGPPMSLFWRGGAGAAYLSFGMPTRHLAQPQTEYLSSVLGALRQAGADLPGEYLGLIAGLKPEGEDALLRHELAQALLLAQSGDRDAARLHMRKALEMRPDNELAIQTALLEQEAGDNKAAIALLERTILPANPPDKNALLRLLELAKAEKNEEVARKTLARLITLSLQRHEEQMLIADLKQYGLAEKAEELQQRITTMSGARYHPHQTAERLQQLQQQGKKEAAIALAHTTLAKTPSVRSQDGSEQYNRNTALGVLQHFKVLDAYIEEREKELEASGQLTIGLGLKLVEAYQRDSRDKALEMVRKLVALAPDDQQLLFYLANFLQNHDRGEEAIPLQLTALRKSPELFITNPYPVINGITGRLREREQKGEDTRVVREQLDEVLKIALSLSAAQFIGAQQNGVWFYKNLGDSVKGISPESAITLWEKGVELGGDPYQSFVLRQDLINSYIDSKREGEARKHLIAYFFPENESTAKLALGHQPSYRQPSPWMQQVSSQQDGSVTIPALRVARLALRLGLKDELLAKQKADGVDNLFPLFLRLAERDLKLPEEIAKSGVPNPTQGNPYAFLFAQAVANDAATWPGIGDQPIRILQKLTGDAFLVTNPWQKLALLRQIIHIAKQTKDTAALDEALKQWCAELNRSGNAAQSVGVDQLAYVGMELLRREMVAEARQMLNLSRAQLRGNNYQPEIFKALENTLLLAEGKNVQPEALIAVASQTDGDATLFWNIEPYARSSAGQDNSNLPFITDEESPFVDKKYDLELLHLTPPNQVERIALIPKAAARGQWKGKLPGPRGSISARLISGDTEYQGLWTDYSLGKNLLAPNGWRYPGSSEPVSEKDRLYPGSISTRVEGASNNEEEIISSRVAIQPGGRYQISGWLYTAGNSGANISLRCLDANGREISNDWINRPQSNQPGWGRIGKRFFVSGKDPRESDYQRLNGNTAAVEISVRIRGTVRLLDISLTEVKEATTAAQ